MMLDGNQIDNCDLLPTVWSFKRFTCIVPPENYVLRKQN